MALQIAVVRETDAKGPFSSTVLAVVVVKDVLLFICLAMNLEFATMVSTAEPVCQHCACTAASMHSTEHAQHRACTAHSMHST